MNKKYNLLIGIGALAVLYFAFKKKGTTTKSSTTANSSISTQTNMSKTGDEKIKALINDLETNEPKNTEEAKARMKKFGVSQVELDVFLAKAFSMPPKKMGFDSILSEERTSGSNSRIKPTSVSGLVVAKRPRNYGTAQRPTRTLMGRKVNPMATTQTMDFDGNDDVLGSIM
jgi:hypothetical protein